MNAEEEAKLKAYSAPRTLSAAERRVWNALVLQCPLRVFTASEHSLLVAYCKTDTLIVDLNSRTKHLLRSERAKLARLIQQQRQIRLTLRIRELARKEARSAEETIAEEQQRIEQAMQDPSHPRYQLCGIRVRNAS